MTPTARLLVAAGAIVAVAAVSVVLHLSSLAIAFAILVTWLVLSSAELLLHRGDPASDLALDRRTDLLSVAGTILFGVHFLLDNHPGFAIASFVVAAGLILQYVRKRSAHVADERS